LRLTQPEPFELKEEKMKRLLMLLAVFSGAVLIAAINGTKHDLPTNRVGAGASELCQPCHVPHDSDPYGDTAKPLWNHEQTDDTSGYTFYTALDGDTITELNSISKQCLGCHDGVVGVDNFGGGSPGGDVMGNGEAGYVGKDLSKEHPISVVYPSSGDFEATPTGGVKLYRTGGTDYIECASCHDPHSNATSMLRVAQDADSALCTSCHTK
jgi:predicted CXXCH cytochrome family protein